MTEPHGYVALYCRISKDRTGREEGVENQERWGRAYAAQTWPGVPVRVFGDNNLSAAEDGPRPGYEALRAALAAGQVAHLWAVEQSRLERRELGWFVLAAELDAAGITELHTNRDGIVRVRDDVAGIKAVLAAGEVRKLKRRVRERLEANAEKGLPPGGRIFGYARTVNGNGDKTLAIVEEEAAVIRECAERVLAGWSLANITADLVGRGLTGTIKRGGRPTILRYTAVRSWLTSPTVAGRRVHRGEDLREGNWPAILDEPTWRAVCAHLAGPRLVRTDDGGEHKVVPSRRVARRYLLSGGLARCGVCGAALRAGLRKIGNRQMGYYQCGAGFCVSAPADTLETITVDRLKAELWNPAFVEAWAQDDHAADRDALARAIEDTRARRRELARERARGELTRDEWAAMRDELDGQERRLGSELASVPAPVSSLHIEEVRAGIDALNFDETREILRMFISRVTLGRSRTTGRAPFDTSRIAIEWCSA